MNFLAHAYLSFDHPQLLIGNMISDFVKGKAQYSFATGIQKGILLHRSIDDFTDTHAATHEAKKIFSPYYRLYSGPITDVLYDHFLANDQNIFTERSLKSFTQHTYACLEEHITQLPDKFVMVLGYMKSQDWPFNYRSHAGIQRSLMGLARRATYLSESDVAYNLFLSHYVTLKELYDDFIKDIQVFSKEKINELLS
jgi:acyl carrier protein phosphodiesterase